MEFSMYVYPWDILDEGIEESLEYIKEIGMDKISLAVSYHSGKFLLPHNPRRKVYYHQGGTVYFKPNYKRYGILKPRLGDAYIEYQEIYNDGREKDLLTRIIEVANKINLGVRLWIVGFHNSRLGCLYPQYTIHNVFGEPYYHGLCPSYQETQNYVLQMLRDVVKQYKFDELELETFDFMGFSHEDHHEKIGFINKLLIEKLLGLCFCDNCCKIGMGNGIDVDKLKTEVKKCLSDIFIMKSMKNLDKLNEFEEYISMRSNIIKSIYRKIKDIIDNSRKKISLYSPYWLTEGYDPKFHGLNPKLLENYVDGWIVSYMNKIEELEIFIKKARGSIPKNKKIFGGLWMLEPQLGKTNNIIKFIEKYSEIGLDGINFYNYGLTSKSVLTKITEYLK